MAGDAAAVMRDMEMFALKKWKTTELYVRQFSNKAEKNMASRAPVDTGNLKGAIKSEEKSLGVFLLEVETSIEDSPNPITGTPASEYGDYLEAGHFNVFLRKSVPPMYFMEGGVTDAYQDFVGKLSGIWDGI